MDWWGRLPRRNRVWFILGMATVALLAAGYAIVAAAKDDERRDSTASGAYDACQDFVRDRVPRPHAIAFPDIDDVEVEATAGGWVVDGRYVSDSAGDEPFVCSVSDTSATGRWRLVDLQIG